MIKSPQKMSTTTAVSRGNNINDCRLHIFEISAKDRYERKIPLVRLLLLDSGADNRFLPPLLINYTKVESARAFHEEKFKRDLLAW